MSLPPARPGPAASRRRPPALRAAAVTAALVGGLWAQEIVDTLAGGRLDAWGIQPRRVDTLWHVLTAPFLHAGFGHLSANTVPLAALTFMSALRGTARFVAATAIIVAVGGGLVWLLGRGGSTHLGASELVFGYLAYVLGRGWWERTPAAAVTALVAGGLYGGLLWGVLPTHPVISWEAHLFGFLAGLLAALLLHGRRPR